MSARAPVLLTDLASVAMGFALFASSIAFPQILELPRASGGFGLPLLSASLVLTPSGFAMLAMSPVAGRIERRFGPKPLLVAGAAIITLGYALALALDLHVWHVLAINALLGVGIGLDCAAVPSLIMRAVPSHETAAANGINTLMRSLGTAVASAAIAAILAQSAVVVDGVARPGADAFDTAYLFALVAAGLSALIASLIPKPRHHPGEHESLPQRD